MQGRDLKLFINIPTLFTKRVKLRKISKSDLKDVYAYASDPEVSKFLLWSPHRCIQDTTHYLSCITKKYKNGEFYDWGIEYEGKIIGTVGFTSFSVAHNVGEIGYVLSSKYWGMGIASEAAERIIRFGFETLSLNRIEARYMIENEASRKVGEKLGMSLEGVIRGGVFAKGKFKDVGLMSILREEYINNRNLL